MAKRLPPLINLRRIRLLRDETQAELGARCVPPLSGQFIGMLENGFRPTSEAQIAALAAALEVDAEALTAERIRVDISSPAGVVRVSA